MIFIIIMFCLLVCCVLVYCNLFFKNNNRKTFIFKIIASSIFLIIGIYSIITNISGKDFDYTQIMVLVGLIMCVLGDILIGLRRIYIQKKDLFVFLGMVFFLLAHFTFGASFLINFDGKYTYAFIAIFALWIGIVLLLKYTKIEFGKFLIPCYIYILSASILFSVALFGLLAKVNLGSINLFTGITLFIISDIFLCYTYYKKELSHPKTIKYISALTYFIGEALIALSIFLF